MTAASLVALTLTLIGNHGSVAEARDTNVRVSSDATGRGEPEMFRASIALFTPGLMAIGMSYLTLLSGFGCGRQYDSSWAATIVGAIVFIVFISATLFPAALC